jgi:hypothetical protein
MFLQRNTASQVFTVPGTLRAIADGSAVTSGATLTWIKDGTSGASAGTLTHVSDGGYTYAPTQGETDAKICGWVLSKTGAAGLAGSVRTTNADPNDAAALGLTRLDATVTSITAILGALNTAAAAGDPGTTTTLVAYLKQLINILIGSAGVATFPASAVPGDAVSLAEVIRKIYDLRAADTAQTGDAYAKVNDGTSGNAALLAAIQNVQNNTFIATSIPYMLERPDAGSATVNVSIVFADETGAAKNLDSGSPTITLVNDSGTDLSSRLGSITNPATGKYVVPYTNSAGDTIDGLHWDITGTVNSKARRMVAYTQIVDTTAVDFTGTDRTNLGTILTRIGTPANVSLANDVAAVGTSAASAATNAGSAASAAGSAAASAGTAVTQTTGSAIAAAVLDAATSGHQTAGTVGKAITDAASAGAAPTAPAIADAVWDEVRTGHTTANTFGKFLDAQVSTISGGGGGGGAVDVSFAQAAAALGVDTPDAGTIGVRRGDSISTRLTGLGDISARTKLWLTVKENPDVEADAASVIQVEETAGAVYINRKSASASDLASLTVDDAAAGDITLVITAAGAALLKPGTYSYDVQMLTASGVTTLATGSFVVSSDVTNALT